MKIYDGYMSEDQQGLHEYLKQMQELREGMVARSRPSDLLYLGMEDFLLKHGRWYTPQPLPEKYELGRIKECFNNAFDLALQEADLRYVEGIVSAIIPVHHGWCTDREGNVIETTLREPGHAYCGIEVPIGKVFARLKQQNTVLDCWKSKFAIYRKPFKPFFKTSYGKELQMRDLCLCGSGLPCRWEFDAQGIALCRTCPKCREQKLAKFRPEILTGYTQADVDEPIESEDA